MCTKGSLRQFRWVLSPPGLLFMTCNRGIIFRTVLWGHVICHIYTKNGWKLQVLCDTRRFAAGCCSLLPLPALNFKACLKNTIMPTPVLKLIFQFDQPQLLNNQTHEKIGNFHCMIYILSCLTWGTILNHFYLRRLGIATSAPVRIIGSGLVCTLCYISITLRQIRILHGKWCKRVIQNYLCRMHATMLGYL